MRLLPLPRTGRVVDDHPMLVLARWMSVPLLLGLSLVRGEKCSDALSCMHLIDGVRNDMEREDLFSICSKTMKFVTCIEASIKDCHMKNMPIPPDNMEHLTNSISQAKNIYNVYCDGVTPNPKNRLEQAKGPSFQSVPHRASCTDISQCMLDVSAYTNSVSNGQTKQACNLISPSVSCMQSAILDCERNGKMSDKMIGKFKESLEMSRTRLNEFCVADTNTRDYETVEEKPPKDTASGMSAGWSCLVGWVIWLAVLKSLESTEG